MSDRETWRRRRAEMEAGQGRNSAVGRRRLPIMRTVLHVGGFFARLLGLAQLGRRGAVNLDLTEFELACPGLAPAFDGYTILHISDTHLEAIPEIVPVAAARIRGRPVDLAVFTGDYQSDGGGFVSVPERCADLMRPLVEVIEARDGIFGILGNHDSRHMVEPLEAIGVRMLLNERVTVRRGPDELHVVGLDDLHAFYTEAAELMLHEHVSGLRILLAHTPELAGAAADAGFGLYLAGHTHGGQICLPNGRALMTGLDVHSALFSGYWRMGDMHGYTNRGLGIASVPFRINCPAEIALITLRVAS
jgi:predicted MPP superfamily phosphohydrolase